MQDMSIDLSLAVNYIPACACAVQSVALSFVLWAVHSVKLLPIFVSICLVLVVDRAQPRSLRIFDGSAVLFSIFASHCVAAVQEFGDGAVSLWPVVHLFFTVEWPLSAGYLLVRPPAHRDFLRLCFAGACFRVSTCAFLHRPEYSELRLVRVGRDLVFAALCLFWTYGVGLYRRRLSRDPSESASHFAVYFWPVLYVHPYAAAAYAAAAAAVVCVQMRQADSGESSPRSCHQAPPAPPALPQEPALEAVGEGDEEMLRQLMGARLGTV